MLLAIDIGNTTVQLGLFDGAKLGPTWRIATAHDRLEDEYGVLLRALLRTREIDPQTIQAVVIASVVPALIPVFRGVASSYFGVEPMLVGSGLKTGLRITYDSPREVGADRVVDAVAALALYGPPPLIVVDFGTATVFDAIDREGDYLGGAIAPGIGVAADALFERASRLSRVELQRPESAIGRNTEAAVQSGIIFGYVGLVEGIIERFKAELGGGRVIGTGGWAERIAEETKAVEVVAPDLTMEGLRLIYDMNAGV
jgi:type III pantothenate kinase